jgi:8-oxo-dGTP diphosphatase
MLSIVIGIVKNAAGEIFITRRHTNLHQGGLWEFAGGKVETGESLQTALARELKEEIGIDVIEAVPLIQLKHDYSDRTVELNVFLITDYKGEAKSLLGQESAWVKVGDLENYPFPAANKTILTALRLPPCYAILNDSSNNLLAKLTHLLAQNIKLIQARLKNLTAEQAYEFLTIAYPLCQIHGALLLVNSSAAGEYKTHCDGIHLTSRDLLALKKRPKNLRWLSASCHNVEELRHAEKMGVDFAVLAPVLPTKTHPETVPLGWNTFSEWVKECNIPVYALGGVNQADLHTAKTHGAQGIAGIRAFEINAE